MASPGVGFNGINALASRVLTVLQPCGTPGAGFNGINALASHVLMALQPYDSVLSQWTTSAVCYNTAVLYSKDLTGI